MSKLSLDVVKYKIVSDFVEKRDDKSFRILNLDYIGFI